MSIHLSIEPASITVHPSNKYFFFIFNINKIPFIKVMLWNDVGLIFKHTHLVRCVTFRVVSTRTSIIESYALQLSG